MEIGFMLNMSTSIDTMTPVYGSGKQFTETFDNLPDARKAASLVNQALDLVRGNYVECNVDVLEGLARDVANVFNDNADATKDELKTKVIAVLEAKIEEERQEAAQW